MALHSQQVLVLQVGVYRHQIPRQLMQNKFVALQQLLDHSDQVFAQLLLQRLAFSNMQRIPGYL
jgi:hypothetical protein